MKKKLLFIAPDYYDFDKVVLDGLLTYSGYEVMSLTSNFKYRYKNFFENFPAEKLKKRKNRTLYIRKA